MALRTDVNSRVMQRLEIARRLMKWPQDGCTLEKINKLPSHAKAKLKELTDWVEDYEKNEY